MLFYPVDMMTSETLVSFKSAMLGVFQFFELRKICAHINIIYLTVKY